MHLGKKMYGKWNLQSIIVAICIMFVCIGTQRIQTVKWDSGLIDLSRDSLGIWMAIIIMTNYKWSDFVKYRKVYGIWTVLGLTLGLLFTPIVITKRLPYLAADTAIIALGIFLMGYCVIHTLISFFLEGYRPRAYKPLLIIWTVMMLWMIISRSNYLWPLCYFVLFLCYYMTEQTTEQRFHTINGMLNGMIAGFILIQAHALLCRPYDIVRYQGNFCNPNHNCMFLCMCLVAIWGKILILTKQGGQRLAKVFCYLLAGACLSLICMTVCRSGYLTTFVVTVFFLISYSVIRRKCMFFRMGIVLVLVFAVLFPATYAAVRYVPTIHPHVVFYYQEGYSESRVHSWDPRDSGKFISFEVLIDQIFGRIDLARELPVEETIAEEPVVSLSPMVPASKDILLVSNGPTLSLGGQIPLEYEVPETDPDKIPALTPEEAASAFTVRYTIYKWYWDHLSLFGMPYDEQGFQLTETHWIQDTHNIYLDYGINFGWPAMILFTVFIWWGIGRLAKRGFKEGDVKKMACLLIALVPPVFGLFEFSWGAGMISTVAFYLSFKEMVIKE